MCTMILSTLYTIIYCNIIQYSIIQYLYKIKHCPNLIASLPPRPREGVVVRGTWGCGVLFCLDHRVGVANPSKLAQFFREEVALPVVPRRARRCLGAGPSAPSASPAKSAAAVGCAGAGLCPGALFRAPPRMRNLSIDVYQSSSISLSTFLELITWAKFHII